MLPEGMRAVIKKNSYDMPPIFNLIKTSGNIAEEMMYNTYNMGIGMMLVVDPADADEAMKAIEKAGETPYKVGYIEAGEKGVTLIGG
jgi:phosphoribosylformylglycinamidine cyclo-ligase